MAGTGYHTHNLEAYSPKPGSSKIHYRPPPVERSAEAQTFYVPQESVNNLSIFINLTSGSYSLSASQLKDFEVFGSRHTKQCYHDPVRALGQGTYWNK